MGDFDKEDTTIIIIIYVIIFLFYSIMISVYSRVGREIPWCR